MMKEGKGEQGWKESVPKRFKLKKIRKIFIATAG